MSKYVKTEQGYVKKIGEVGTGLESEIFNDYTNNIASGQYSHAEGFDTAAHGHTSHAEGYRTIASGSYSHAEGYRTTASGHTSHVEGRYNIEDTSSTYAHIVGNGSTSTRSNAHTLDWNGNAEYQGDVIANGCGGNNPISLINMSTQVEALKGDLGSLSLGTHTDNLAYIFRDGQPIGNGIEMTGGSGGNSEWRKVAELKTEEDLTYISVTEDMEGNPLSFDEAIVICSGARPTDATANGNLVISPSPEWRSSFMCWGISGFQLYGDVYTYGVHFKKFDDYVLMQVVMNKRTASNLGVLPNKFELFENSVTGASTSNDKMISAGIKSRYCKGTNNSLILDLFNDENKMRGITVGVDMATSVKIGAGSTLEVWVK